ncbi:MAG: tRNA dihydrouridine(20/20a) synthase DusA [endosymbiont of Galathealinum brachiosum]|uniref:tRNA-dihydrouridine(20/20a) synthase n=1 Tax=endosymbiont of Galathealinum brachiosum TaxID=2200906 RepID=A0A370DDT4_9GAMM|nr:MAG: tRNA dihydrouridine(20/20a) synthase DusA [endosymbiont of Galathealinum brachiosum]
MNRKFSVAPMLDWTDRHERFFLRLISQHTLLYTEMITTGALIHGDRSRHLDFNYEEHPVAIQLGGSDPVDLAECAKMSEDHGYDEINLNVGCPSNRVQSGMFGACLMAKPKLVAECVAAMQDVVDIPVTVKHRIGIDENETVEELFEFVEVVAKSGCKSFIVHARKAWLNGLSPKQNRDIPPLRYDVVHLLKQTMPELEIIINGGICDLDTAENQLKYIDGIMMGREVYHNPYILAEVDQRFYQSETPVLSRQQIMELMFPYVEKELAKGLRLHTMTRHILGLYNGLPGAKKWRRFLSENATKREAGIDVLYKSLECLG